MKEERKIMTLMVIFNLIGIGLAIAAPGPVTLVCAGINLGVLYCLYCSILGGLK